jgi:hypothetical protein
MKEQKTMIQLVSRYQNSPLNAFEQFGMGMMMVFFLFMLFLFLIRPLI